MDHDKLLQAVADSGYTNGDLFKSEREVREYFTVENMRFMFGASDEPIVETDPGEFSRAPWTQDELNQMADYVLFNRSHCAIF
jgi:hypothetical protein